MTYTLLGFIALLLVAYASYQIGYDRGIGIGAVSHHHSSTFAYSVVAKASKENDLSTCDAMAKFGLLKAILRLEWIKKNTLLTEEEKEWISDLQRQTYTNNEHSDLFTVTGEMNEDSAAKIMDVAIQKIKTDPRFYDLLRELGIEPVGAGQPDNPPVKL